MWFTVMCFIFREGNKTFFYLEQLFSSYLKNDRGDLKRLPLKLWTMNCSRLPILVFCFINICSTVWLNYRLKNKTEGLLHTKRLTFIHITAVWGGNVRSYTKRVAVLSYIFQHAFRAYAGHVLQRLSTWVGDCCSGMCASDQQLFIFKYI